MVLPVQLPVSGRTLGRHVSLGPGWEANREEAAAAAEEAAAAAAAAAYDQASTSHASLSPMMHEVRGRGCCWA